MLAVTLPDSKYLNRDVLVAERLSHQPAATARAMRQINRLAIPATMMAANNSTATSKEDTPVRDALLKRLTDLLPPDEHQETTAGADRRIRHAGSYVSRRTTAARSAVHEANIIVCLF